MSLKLKELREHNNKSQYDIAKILNMKQEQYWRYEKEIRPIRIEYLIKLANYYNTSTDYILGITEEKTPYRKI